MQSQIKLMFKIRNTECVVYFIKKTIHEKLRINWIKQWVDFPWSVVKRYFSIYIVRLFENLFANVRKWRFGEPEIPLAA